MSGGSWEYMYGWDESKFLDMRGNVSAMATRLIRSGHLDAAKAMEDFYIVLEHAHIAISARSQALRDIMHAVEWVDSCDSSEEQLTEAVNKWSRPQ